MKKLIVVGIDPGMHGAIGAIYPGNKALAWPTPNLKTRSVKRGLTKSGKKRYSTTYDYDEPAMASLLAPFVALQKRGYEIAVAIERVQAMPDSHKGARQGSTAIFRFGTAYGIWLGIIGALGLKPNCKKVGPGEWKPWLVGVGAEKSMSLKVCRGLYPELDLLLVKDADRAEAILIAEFRRRQILGLGMPRNYVRPKPKKKKDSTQKSRKSVAVQALMEPPTTKRRSLPKTTRIKK